MAAQNTTQHRGTCLEMATIALRLSRDVRSPASVRRRYPENMIGSCPAVLRDRFLARRSGLVVAAIALVVSPNPLMATTPRPQSRTTHAIPSRAIECGPLFVHEVAGSSDFVRRPSAARSAREICVELFAGPNSIERARGLTTAIPAGCRCLAVEPFDGPTGSGHRVVVDETFPAGARVELAIEQVTKSLDGFGSAVEILIENDAGVRRTLRQVLDRGAAVLSRTDASTQRLVTSPSVAGYALAGKRIAVSPGHGYYWHPTLGWTTQRPLIGGLIEDIHTNEIAIRYLIPYLENMGAEVVSCRDVGEMPSEGIVDDDPPSSRFRTTGTWTESSYYGYLGGKYRYAFTSPVANSVATWTYSIPRTGYWPIHAWLRAGVNRSSDARYEIRHGDTTSVVRIDQKQNDAVFVPLGTWWFEQGETATVSLDNQSATTGSVVIADAIRFGNGLGTIVRGTSSSGKLRAQECSRYWAMYQGAPSTVYDSSTGDDHTDDVTCRPRYAEWRGADCFVSLHTNAGGGSGTSSYIHSTSPTPGSAALQTAVQSQIVSDIRRYYDTTWIDRGRQSANFGELRLLSTMPGVLVELAFHDQNGSRDHNALHDPVFRQIAARAFARGVLRYFTSSAPFPPTRPETLRVVQDGSGGLRVTWDVVSGASSYIVEQSEDGKNFVEVARVQGTSWSTGVLSYHGSAAFRVRAENSTGRSFPSEVLCAGTSHDHRAEVLLVAGFDRLGKTVKGPENTRDYSRQHADALRRHGAWSLGFDATSNEALTLGHVKLEDYRAVIWCAGEESTVDETFSYAEQALVSRYLARGGRLLVSGAEVGWDLDAKGTSVDQAFFRQELGALYVRDDAATYQFRSAAQGPLTGLPAGSFDDGSGSTYDVDYPDVLAPADSRGSIWLHYGTSSLDGAAVARDNGTSRVVVFGFPIETIRDDALRSEIVERTLRWLLDPRSFDVPRQVPVGSRTALPIHVPTEPGALYVLAAAAATTPGLRLPDGRSIPLAPDVLFSLSLGANHAVFERFAGFLDANGVATPHLGIPSDVSLRGIRFYLSGLTLGSSAPFSASSLLPWFRVDVR